MNKIFKFSAAALLAAALTAPAASAQLYGDVGAGYLDVEGLETTTFIGRIGYEYNEYLGAEGELGFGLSDDQGFEVDVNTGVFGVLSTPEYFGANLFARVGYGYALFEAPDANNIGEIDSSSTNDVIYGFGAKYFFNDVHGVRIDWTRYDYEDADADHVSISYARKF